MAETTKVLQRLPKQGQITGVCAGIAEYMAIDVTLVRIVFILLGVITGGGFILVYIILAIVMPSAHAVSSDDRTGDISRNLQSLADDMRTEGQQKRLRNFIGFGLVVVGVWLLLNQVFPNVLTLGWRYIWPVVLILAGVFIATRRKEI